MAKKQGTSSSKPKKKREGPTEEKKQASVASQSSGSQEPSTTEGRFSRKSIERKTWEKPLKQQEPSTTEGRFSRKSIERKIGEYRRILTLTRRPTREEFSTIAKVAAIGIVIIGVGGFLIYLAMVQLPSNVLNATSAQSNTTSATQSGLVNISQPLVNVTTNSSVTSSASATANASVQTNTS
jgi:protein transport protein SEC61 subunit gamma-like protein